MTTESPKSRRTGALCYQAQGGRRMMKIAFVLAAAVVLTTSPLATPTRAQELKMAQGIDVQIGRDRSDRYDRDRRRDDATVGIGPGGVTIGPRQRCRTVTTTVEREDGRRITGQGAPRRLNGEQHRRCRLLPSGSCSFRPRVFFAARDREHLTFCRAPSPAFVRRQHQREFS